MKPKTFKIATLGCRTNQYESQALRAQLLALGHKEVQEGEKADICLVNTCTVTEGADSSSRHQIRRLLRENPGAKMVVTGCMEKRKLEGIEGVNAHVPNEGKEKLVQTLFPEADVPEFKINHFEAHTRAFVKVQDGCNSFCTYCIIPYVRGRSRSKPLDKVLQEVRGLIDSGYKEVVITGINVGDFDGSGKRLSDLIRAVDKLEGLKRLRVSSIDPDEVDDDLADAILNGKTTCPSMHIVLQSGSNVVLKRMNRKYTRQMFFDTVERLKKASPSFTFTTDIIVGFPGETESDFQETLEVVKETQFAKVHVFPYSKRERTRAALYKNTVPSLVISERKGRLLRAYEQEAFQLRERFLGQKMEVLTENNEMGHTANFLLVHLKNEGRVRQNELVQVELVENTPSGFIGKIVS